MFLSLATWVSALTLAAYTGTVGAHPYILRAEAQNTSCIKTLGLPQEWSRNTTCNGGAEQTCAILQYLVPGSTPVTNSSSDYVPNVEFPHSQACWKKAACFVAPKSSKEVSDIMKVLTATRTKFSVRSQGQLPIPGYNGVDADGVVIAMADMNKKILSAGKSTATVGTGNNWAAVYNWIEPQGVQVIGGRESVVGVGGFLLGGSRSSFLLNRAKLIFDFRRHFILP
jgi:hypothetical protein